MPIPLSNIARCNPENEDVTRYIPEPHYISSASVTADAEDNWLRERIDYVDYVDHFYEYDNLNPSITACALPTEILHIIFGHLSRQDLSPVRLCNKHVYAVASTHFFETLYLGPRIKHLRTLVTIARHPLYRKSVKKIVYDTTWYPSLGYTTFRVSTGKSRFLQVTDEYDKDEMMLLKGINDDQDHLLQDQISSESDCLLDCLPCLPALRKIVVGQRAESIGALSELVNSMLIPAADRDRRIGIGRIQRHGLLACLQAVALTKTGIRELSLGTTTEQSASEKHPILINTLCLSDENLTLARVAFARLHTMSLTIDLDKGSGYHFRTILDKALLAKFVSAAPGLRHLSVDITSASRLNIFDPNNHNIILLEDIIGNALEMDLNTFHLGMKLLPNQMFFLHGADMESFLNRHRRGLQRLTLSGISMHSQCWNQVIAAVKTLPELRSCSFEKCKKYFRRGRNVTRFNWDSETGIKS
ncbi:hypothetical protein LTR66_005636 [Elasticomyces elasticus]|nr:hypothetical protein LTR66_005636 [Elasticomyces elasticus]